MKQLYDFLIVFDLEATCSNQLNYNKFTQQEIIQFPIIFIDTKTLQIKHKFNFFIKPQFQDTLNDYTIELTGITDENICHADVFSKVFLEIQTKITEITKNQTVALVIDGDWDLKTMLPMQCLRSNIQLPELFTEWVNLKIMFSKATNITGKMDIKEMCDYFDLEVIGRLHNGFDDAMNISQVLINLCKIYKIELTTENVNKNFIQYEMGNFDMLKNLETFTKQNTNERDFTVIFYLINNNRWDLFNQYKKQLQPLVNIKTKNNWTPLMHAADKGNLDICKWLIDNGARIEDVVGASANWSALHSAAKCENLTLYKYLVEKGGNEHMVGLCKEEMVTPYSMFKKIENKLKLKTEREIETKREIETESQLE